MKNNNQTYSGKSIAEQLLGNTWVGRLLYGKPETYKDGYNQERKDATFKESANGQQVQRMKETAISAGRTVADNLLDIPMDVYSGIESGIKSDWTGVGLAAASVILPQSVEFGLKHRRRIEDLLPEFRTLLGKESSRFSDDQLKYILQQREQSLLNTSGRHTISTPKRIELYEDGELQGYLDLGNPGKEGLTINWVENITKQSGKPVSPELYSGGIHQAQDLNYSGLESGHHLRNESATRRNINLDNFDGRIIGMGKADAQNFEEYIQGKVNYYKSQLERTYEMSPEELENELIEYEDKLRKNLKDRNEFAKTDEFKERIDKIDWPYETDVLLLTKSKTDFPTHSLLPDIKSIEHWMNTGIWDLSKYHKQGGILKSQQGIKLLTLHKDYLGIPYKQDVDYNYYAAYPTNIPTKPEEHWTSRNPVTGQLLKSENHPTFNLLLNGEKEVGMQIYSGLNGELYSYPKEQQVPLYLKKYNYGNR